MNIELKIELPEDIFSALRTDPVDFVKQMRIVAAIKWYELGRISQSKASEIAGISLQEFLENLDVYGLSPYQVTEEELLKESSIG